MLICGSCLRPRRLQEDNIGGLLTNSTFKFHEKGPIFKHEMIMSWSHKWMCIRTSGRRWTYRRSPITPTLQLILCHFTILTSVGQEHRNCCNRRQQFLCVMWFGEPNPIFEFVLCGFYSRVITQKYNPHEWRGFLAEQWNQICCENFSPHKQKI